MRLLSPDDLKAKKGIDYSRQHLHKLIRMGRFPRPVKIGENKNAFVEKEVDEWIQIRIAARDKRDRTSAASRQGEVA
jgi:prophage regulatory protein